jgi:hypothetical protein
VCRYGVFKVRRAHSPNEKAAPQDGLSKLSSVVIEVDILLGEPVGRTAEAINEPAASGVIAPESLERR